MPVVDRQHALFFLQFALTQKQTTLLHIQQPKRVLSLPSGARPQKLLIQNLIVEVFVGHSRARWFRPRCLAVVIVVLAGIVLLILNIQEVESARRDLAVVHLGVKQLEGYVLLQRVDIALESLDSRRLPHPLRYAPVSILRQLVDGQKDILQQSHQSGILKTRVF